MRDLLLVAFGKYTLLQLFIRGYITVSKKWYESQKSVKKLRKCVRKGYYFIYIIIHNKQPQGKSNPKIIKTTNKQATESNACPKNKTKQRTRACQEYHN